LADVKISGLPASTTPLAGTEVLPIVQGGQTRQVSVTNLTAGRAVSATSYTPTGATIPVNGVYLPAANNVGFATNSGERMRIDNTGNVVIGTTTALLSAADRGNITVNGATSSVLAFGNAGVNSGYIFTSAPTLEIDAAGTRYINFRTSSAERMRISASGGVSIGNTTDAGATNLNVAGTGKFGTTVAVGAATPSASGAGITFPATQSASTDPNTLDDYEEGTWNPSFYTAANGGGSLIGTVTNGGYYTKIGRYIFCTFARGNLAGANHASVSLPFAIPANSVTTFTTADGAFGYGDPGSFANLRTTEGVFSRAAFSYWL